MYSYLLVGYINFATYLLKSSDGFVNFDCSMQEERRTFIEILNTTFLPKIKCITVQITKISFQFLIIRQTTISELYFIFVLL